MNSTSADWSDGYVTSHPYTAKYYSHLAPDHLNFACALHGAQPAELGERFNYFELGCGLGVSATVLASCHPEAHFFANDFMPAHVAAARDVQRQGEVGNLTLLENSFAELAEGHVDLPPMDFITLHGVYTWVPAEARAQIVKFIARYLKPGGIAYLGYNAMPGWAGALPLQRLIHHIALQTPGDMASKAARARDFVLRLSESGADYFRDKPDVARRLAQISGAGNSYLAHEYMHREWQPMYHSDVARDLAAAKLDFVGSSMLLRFFDEFPTEQQAAVDAVADPAWKETIKDFLLGSGFRSDIFVRGARAISPDRRSALLGRFVAAPARPLATSMALIEESCAVNRESRSAFAELTRAITHQPLAVGDLCGPRRAYDQQDLNLLALTCLSHLGVLHLVDGSRPTPACGAAQSLNRAVAAASLAEEGCDVLASPRARSGVRLTLLERCVYSLIVSEQTEAPDALFEALTRTLDRSADLRQRLSAEQVDVSSSLLRAEVTRVIQGSLPLWKCLKAIDKSPPDQV